MSEDNRIPIVLFSSAEKKIFCCKYLDGERQKQKPVLLIILLVLLSGTIIAVLTLVCGLHECSNAPYQTQPGLSANKPDLGSRGYGTYRFAAVSTGTDVCSTIATEILAKHGGSAVDAAIAAMLCVGVVSPHRAGIGGGHFMNIYAKPRDSDFKVMSTIDAREVAPAAAHKDIFANITGPVFGGLSVGVPGEIAGYFQAWKIFGHLKWKELLYPAIKLCMDGFRVESDLAHLLQVRKKAITADPGLSSLFIKDDGTLLKERDIVFWRKLGRTLQQIAEHPMTMYNGTLAKGLVADLRERGGIITQDDMQNYKVKVKNPLRMTLHNGNYTINVLRPPSGGVVLGFILRILDGYNFSRESIMPSNTALTYHRITEAYKFAYSRRAQLADEDFVKLDTLMSNMMSKSYAEAIRRRINDIITQPLAYYNATYDGPTDHGTAHVSVLAPDGSAVAISGSLNWRLGSRVVGSRTGIIFNNELDDFSRPNADNLNGFPNPPANFIEPLKRPLSSMCPAIIFDSSGKVVAVIGGTGGTKIISAVAQTIIHNLWFKERLDKAVEAPRFHSKLLPDYVNIEADLPEDIIKQLKARGHKIRFARHTSAVIAIQNKCADCEVTCRKLDCIHAASDTRRGGAPDGY